MGKISKNQLILRKKWYKYLKPGIVPPNYLVLQSTEKLDLIYKFERNKFKTYCSGMGYNNLYSYTVNNINQEEQIDSRI